MSQQDITPREALMQLGASTAEAIAKVLEMFAPGAVERGEVTVLEDGASPFANVARGSIASSVSYVDGVTGANIFVLTPAGARGLAAAMGRRREEADAGAGPLSELEMSAIAEAANQMMAAAAAAIGVVLGQEIEISPPDTRVLDDPGSAADIYGTAPHATSTTFMIAGEACRLIQLVPRAFVVRMVRAIDEETAERTGDKVAGGSSAADGRVADTSPHSLALEEALGGISLRVWAELGRARMPLGNRPGAAGRSGRRSRPRRRRARRPVRQRDALRPGPARGHRGRRMGGVARRPRERGAPHARPGPINPARGSGRRRAGRPIPSKSSPISR